VTLRTKLMLALASLAAAATIAIGFFSYTATASRLNAQINSSLDSTAQSMVNAIQGGEPGSGYGHGGVRLPPASDQLVLQQFIDPAGRVYGLPGALSIPVTQRDRDVTALGDDNEGVRRTVKIDGRNYRVETVSVGNGQGAVQVARDLSENEAVLAALRNRILIATVLIVIAGALIGWWIAGQITRRLTRLTNTAEEVTKTGMLDVAVPVQGTDETGRLAVAFNEMLSALARSKEDQQRLVQDAGHELRTPLTSLRTNTSILRRHELSTEERGQILDDLDSETKELTDLVNELVELATDRSRDEKVTEVDLADVAKRVAARAERRTNRSVTVDADDSVVLVRRQGVERAVSNLVDNALKFDESDAPVEIVVHQGVVTVLDRGPGIDAEDREHVFDRFFRAVGARSRPGSGLGLSIVRDVADRHHGSVFAEPREGGGSAIGFRLPPIANDGETDPATDPGA
jgi:two-component system, OmpR family, sensor histidine kinase MprB